MSTNIIPIEREAYAEYWADRINAGHADGVAVIIKTGQDLLAAKARLVHGEWGRLTGETTRQPLMKFSERTARRYMQVANQAAFTNRSHGTDLPVSLRTLAVLSVLPQALIEKLIEDGAINPDMERSEAEDLVHEWRAAAITGTRPMFQHEQQIQPIEALSPAPSPAPSPQPDLSPQREAQLNKQLEDAVNALREGEAQSAAIKASVRGTPAPQGAWAEVLGQLSAITDMAIQLQESLEDRLQPLPLPMGDTHAKLHERLANASQQLATLRLHIETTYLNGEHHAHH